MNGGVRIERRTRAIERPPHGARIEEVVVGHAGSMNPSPA
jgi:hypothetical protein